MNYKVQNTKILTPENLILILHKSAKLYSEYADTTLLFIFRTASGNPRLFNCRDESVKMCISAQNNRGCIQPVKIKRTNIR